ncbi:MAG: FtsX-like permease family protein [Oscillospiraceae bacterium]|nr:FtsX-like permease family protein [Oscillospiraceae bacterium]
MNRLLFPIIKKYWKLLAGTMLVSALGCGMIIGLSSAYLSVDRSVNMYLDEYHYPDAYITADLTERDRLEDLQKIPGVTGVSGRVFGDTVIMDHTGRYLSVRVFSYEDSDPQRFYFWSTADAEGADEAYLEYNFAEENGISTGDTILYRAVDEWREVFISGIISMPETLAVQPTNDGWDTNADFGYAYIPQHLAEKASDVFYDKSTSKLDDKQQELEDAEKALNDGRKELEDARTALDDAKKTLEEKTKEYNDGVQKIADAEEQMSEARSTIASNQSRLESSQAELNSRAATLASRRAEIAGAKAEVDSAQAEIDSGYAQLQSAEAEIRSAQAQLDDAQAQLEAQKAEYTAQWGFLPYEVAKRFADAQSELYYKQLDIDAAWIEASTKRSELEAAQAELDSQAGPVRAAWNEITNAQAQINAAQAEIDSGYAQIRSAQAELDSMQEEYERGKEEIKEAEKAIADAEIEIRDAEAELTDAEAEFEEKQLEWDDADAALADARETLENARFGDKANQFLLWFDDDSDPDETLDAAADALGDIEIGNKYVLKDSAVRERLDSSLHPISTMSIFIPEVFFVILLVIVFLFMSLIIRQCRREIGILRALGFTVGSIRRLFCKINFIVSLLAVIIGFALGWALSIYDGNLYRSFFPLPVFTHILNVRMIVLSTVATLVIGQLATLISATYIAKIRPAEAMSRPAPSTAKIPGGLLKLIRNAHPMTKFSITSLLRNRIRFVFSAICLAATVMMIFASLAFFSSRSYVLSQTYDERIHYDCQIFYSKPLSRGTTDRLNALGYVSDVTALPYYLADISFGGRTETALINVLQPGSELVGVYDRSREPCPMPEEGIILEEHIAQALGASVGDEVLVDGRTMYVKGMSFQCISRCQYISPTGASALGKEDLGTVICNIGEKDEQKLLEFLSEQENYLYTVFTRLSYQGSLKLLRSYDLAAWVIISFSIVIGLVIVINTTRTNLLEKKKELCILRTIGFQHGEISRSWFFQSVLQFIVACILGFPAGHFLAQAALVQITTPTCEYVYANSIKEYVLTALIVFLYMTFSHILAMRSMKKWNIVESVKEKE